MIVNSLNVGPSAGDRRWLRLTGLAAALVLLTACGAGGESRQPTQVAAKVNKEEISVHQINFALRNAPNVQPDNADAASRQVLDALIGQELAVQKALELKLDRTPAVVQALESARREVLARATAEHIAQGAARPTATELTEFYTKRPALFAQRRVYTIEEATIVGGPDVIAKVDAQLRQARTPAEFTSWLRGSGLQYQLGVNTLPAENLPIELLDRISGLEVGKATTLRQPGAIKVLLLLNAKSEPIDEATARSAIEQFILNERKRARVDAEMKAMRAAAQIEFVGRFAEAPKPAGGPSVSTAAAAASSPAVGAASAPGGAVATGAGGEALSADAVKKGLGLK